MNQYIEFSKRDYIFMIIGVLFGVGNNLATQFSPISPVIGIIETLIVTFFLASGNYDKCFSYILLFSALSIEHDTFIYGESMNNATIYTFFNLPIVHGMPFMAILVLLFIEVKRLHSIDNQNETIVEFKKYINLLYITGIAAIILSMTVNDNGIMYGNYYPQTAFLEILKFLPRYIILLLALYYASGLEGRIFLASTCIMALIVVAVTALITSFALNITGWYGASMIMLTPTSIALTPCLIAFMNKNAKKENWLCFIVGILLIIGSFIYPTCIGSKWYLIIIASLMICVISLLNVKSLGVTMVASFLGILLLLNFAEPILSIMGDDFSTWKLSQAINLLNIFDTSSAAWFDNLDRSTLYRIDEMHNTFIEFLNKPWFALFGKGFGGTTQHYTNLLTWEYDSGAFSEAQIKLGAYFNMHETFAVLFLRHGIMGLVFAIFVLKQILSKITRTPLAIVSFIWFIFYWSYGLALVLGSVCLVLTIANNDNENQLLHGKN